MKSLTQYHRYAQVDCIFLKHMPTHFVCLLSQYAVYPTRLNPKTCVMARSWALSMGKTGGKTG